MIQRLSSVGPKYYGIALLEHISGIEYLSLKNIKKVDVLHVGIMDNPEIWDFLRWMARHKIPLERTKRKEKPFIIIGGRGIENATIREIADAVVWGEADELYTKLKGTETLSQVKDTLAGLDYVDTHEQRATVWKNAEITAWGWDYYSAQKVRPRGYFEIGRGCMQRCLFCDLSWTREKTTFLSVDEIRAPLESMVSREVCMLIPDLGDYPETSQAIDIIKECGKNYRYDSEKLKTANYQGKPKNIQIRWGIEGLSERMRKAVGKPIKNEEILAAVKRAQDEGIVSVKFFMIPDLPGTENDDLQEFVWLLDEIEKLRKNMVLRIKFTSFSPDTRSPLRYAAVTPGVARTTSKYILHRKQYGYMHVESAYSRKTEIEHLALQCMNIMGLVSGQGMTDGMVIGEQPEDNPCFDYPLPLKEKYGKIYRKYLERVAKSDKG